MTAVEDPYVDVPPPDVEPPELENAPAVKWRRATEHSAEGEGAPARTPFLDRLLTVSQLRTLGSTTPLIDGLLYQDTLAQLSGPAGCYKTFALTAMECALALGVNLDSYQVPKRQKVVHVAAEGASGLRPRILAWCELANVDPFELDNWLYILPCPIQLGNYIDVTDAVDMVREIGAGLLVLDTRARCTIGIEENSATEQGKAIAAAERIQAAAGCTVLGAHHSSRGGTAGRGSNAWDGAVWTDLRMEGANQQATIHVSKHKDVPSGVDHHFRLVPHTVSPERMPDASETQRKTLVFLSHDREIQGENLMPVETVVRQIVETTSPPEGLTASEIVGFAAEKEISRATIYRCLKSLVKAGAIQNRGTESRARYVPAGGL